MKTYQMKIRETSLAYTTIDAENLNDALTLTQRLYTEGRIQKGETSVDVVAAASWKKGEEPPAGERQ